MSGVVGIPLSPGAALDSWNLLAVADMSTLMRSCWLGRIPWCAVLVFVGLVLPSPAAVAQTAAPGARVGEQPSLMKLLADEGLHDIDNESWNAYGQVTYIPTSKLAFQAPYTNL